MRIRTVRHLVILALAFTGAFSALAQTTSSGTLNVVLTNGSGLQMLLYTDSSGVTLGNSGTAAATLAFGSLSAHGTPPTNVTITNQTSTFTATTYFDVYVQESGLDDPNNGYTLSASVTGTITGVTIQIDGTSLTTTAQNLSGTGTYATDVRHTLGAVISTAASGSGGPTTGTQLTSTINLVATSN